MDRGCCSASTISWLKILAGSPGAVLIKTKAITVVARFAGMIVAYLS
jgi:hypothetical protein